MKYRMSVSPEMIMNLQAQLDLLKGAHKAEAKALKSVVAAHTAEGNKIEKVKTKRTAKKALATAHAKEFAAVSKVLEAHKDETGLISGVAKDQTKFFKDVLKERKVKAPRTPMMIKMEESPSVVPAKIPLRMEKAIVPEVEVPMTPVVPVAVAEAPMVKKERKPRKKVEKKVEKKEEEVVIVAPVMKQKKTKKELEDEEASAYLDRVRQMQMPEPVVPAFVKSKKEKKVSIKKEKKPMSDAQKAALAKGQAALKAKREAKKAQEKKE